MKVAIEGDTVRVEGPKGKLEFTHRPEIEVAMGEDGKSVQVSRRDDERASRAYHGLTRALINNMVLGVKNGYEKKLEIVGVGFLATLKGNKCSCGSASPMNWKRKSRPVWKSHYPIKPIS